MKKCPKCNSNHSNPGAFCSRSCANSRGPRSDEFKRKVSFKLKGRKFPGRNSTDDKKYWGANSYIWGPRTIIHIRICTHCDKTFVTRGGNVCCSEECRYHRKTFNSVKKTHIKYFNQYENIHVDLHSKWEVEIAEKLDKLNIIWKRPHKSIIWDQNTNQRYMPDFFLPDYNVYLDVKNPYKIKTEFDKLSKVKKIIPLKIYQLRNMKRYLEALYRFER